LIAAQSELKSLEQIYTSNNVRVRAVRARIDELQRELNKLGGTGNEGESPSLYPSIRQLPLLGVKYANLYRQTKIEEAVYEFLTKQYELAKVEEAKEIPTIRVLDQPLVPERHDFPPRLLLISLGAVLSFVVGCCWVIGTDVWHSIPAHSPWKALALQVADSAGSVDNARLARAMRRTSKFFGRFRREHKLAVTPAENREFMQRDENNHDDHFSR
jgi:hypothetical protein